MKAVERKRRGRVARNPTFEDFYQRRWHDAARWAAGLTGSAAVGEEIAQEVFLKLMPIFPRLTSPDAYLRRSIVHAAAGWYRSDQRRVRRDMHAVAGALDEEYLIDDRLHGALRQLPYPQRAALVLRYWADWEEQAIADALSCRPATVRTRVKRAIVHLRQILNDLEVSP